MFGGRGMGGASAAGGGMLRTVGRAVPATRVGVAATTSGLQDHFSSNPTSSNSTSPSTSRLTRKPKSLSTPSLSSYSSHSKNSVSGIPVWNSSPETHECDWVYVDGIEDDGAYGFSDHYVVGPVPSEDEVEDAVYALQQMFGPALHAQFDRDKPHFKLDNNVADHITSPGLVSQVSLDGSEIGWAEPYLFSYNSRTSERVYHAFHLLQTEPSVQRMVKSLSSDKAVWDAVLNNEVVRELRESISADEEDALRSPGTSNMDLTTEKVVMWIFDAAKVKFIEVIETITKIVIEFIQPAYQKTAAEAEVPDPFNEKLRTSFMLSIMVLLVVVVSRSHRV